MHARTTEELATTNELQIEIREGSEEDRDSITLNVYSIATAFIRKSSLSATTFIAPWYFGTRTAEVYGSILGDDITLKGFTFITGITSTKSPATNLQWGSDDDGDCESYNRHSVLRRYAAKGQQGHAHGVGESFHLLISPSDRFTGVQSAAYSYMRGPAPSKTRRGGGGVPRSPIRLVSAPL